MSEANMGDVRTELYFGGAAFNVVAALLAEGGSDIDAVHGVAGRVARLREMAEEMTGELHAIEEIVMGGMNRVLDARDEAEAGYGYFAEAGKGSSDTQVSELVAGAKAQVETLGSSAEYVSTIASELHWVHEHLVSVGVVLDSNAMSCRNWTTHREEEQQRATKLAEDATAITNRML